MKQEKLLSLLIIVFLNFLPFLGTAVIAHDKIHVHPFIAEQAFLLWPKDTNSKISNEFRENLGQGYRGDEIKFWDPIICDESKIGEKITEGAKEEDDYDVLLDECNLDLLYPYGFFHHFYQPDDAPPNGLFLEVLGSRSPGALAYAEAYLVKAILHYRADEIPQAYWYLGKIAHLLADMSVPAHVNNDDHLPWDGDSYENYIKNSYYNWTFHTAKHLEDLSGTSLLDKQDITLEKLFWNLAQRSQYFPSNDAYGNDVYSGVNGSTENVISGLAWFDEWMQDPRSLRHFLIDDQVIGDIQVIGYIPDENCNTIGNYLMPLAIQYTAALYKFFWYELHVDINMPDNIQVLNPIEFRGMGKLNGHDVNTWEWDFNYDGENFNPEESGQTVTHTFKEWGEKRIALRATSTEGVSELIVKQITVKPFEIIVDYPEGFESLLRIFSVIESPHVVEYSWDFGDGSPNEFGRVSEHTYTVSGDYTVRLTLTLDDGPSIQSQEVIFVGPGTRILPGHTITGYETWSAGGIYHLLGDITVAESGTLTIEPGAVVKVQYGRQLEVYGTLDAEDVTFTWADGENPWDGIYIINPGSNASRLDGCIIDHARGVYSGGYKGIIYVRNSSPTITGCTIRDSVANRGIEILDGSPTITGTTVSGMTNYGVYVRGDSSPTITGCTLTDNKYGIYVAYSDNNPVFSGNTYSNNSDADLMATGTISSAINWGETTDRGYMLSSFTVAEGASLSIAPGMIIKFQYGGQLEVYGTLDAEDVTFTWADGENPWDGIYIINPGSNASRLDGCIIDHARGVYSGGYKGIIYVRNSSPTITGCTIRDSVANRGIEILDGSPTITGTTVSGMTNYGVYVRGDSSPTITGCTLTDNKYGIYVAYSDNNPVFSGNTYSNNSDADLMATGTISSAINWGETTDRGYMLSSFTVAEGASLSIAPGMIIKFQYGGQLEVYGTLDAEDVTFTWADGENPWDGIYIINPGSNASRLDGCIIDHARGVYSGGYKGIIYVRNSSPTITGCTIRDSVANRGIEILDGSPTITGTTVSGMTNYGVYVRGDSSPMVTGCTLTDNGHGVYIESSGSGTYQSNTIVGNTLFGIYHSGTTVVNATNNYWGYITGPLDDSDDRDSGGWYNPDGLGDRVSDFVEYYPWIGDPYDMDNDSMPDDWEWAIVDANPNDSIEQPLDVLPFDDFDGDGFSNIREFLALSDPVFIQNIPLCWSDFSSDGDVDGIELNTVLMEIGRNDCSHSDPCSCDLDGDGSVDTLDLMFFSEDFGRTDCY